MSHVAETVAQLIYNITEMEEVKNDYDLKIFEEGILDSMGLVQLLVEIEEQLNISVPITEFDREEWATVNKIAVFLEGK